MWKILENYQYFKVSKFRARTDQDMVKRHGENKWTPLDGTPRGGTRPRDGS